ncbi:hypothetical protein SESBI_50491 [Sesbania bispinosa]|nr:hypothetical protein SESBI_50491 [Sesbania bispinosa]
MPFSSWICTNNSKTMLIRIVHPGGRVELHDRPITAAEIMCHNPRCCVAYPYVFQQPWAIVAPDTMLMLGQKNTQSRKEEEEDGMVSTCCIFRKKSTTKQSNNYNSKHESEKSEFRSDERNLSPNVNDDTLTRKMNKDLTANGLRGSPKKAWSFEHWQPSLESITEE